MKPVKDDSGEPEAADKPPASSLSDFLAGGLRESQRPPPPGRESREEGTVVDGGVALAALAAQAPIDGPIDHVGADEPALSDDDSTGAPAGIAPTESDYVVPVPLLARPRLIAGIVEAALLIVAFVFWLSRESKPPPRVDTPRATPAAVTQEPLPPAPPAITDPVEPFLETVDEPAPAGTKVTGAAPAVDPSAAPPFGPNVARYPDLPTPVLIQLEKAQEDKAVTKTK